MLRTDPAFYDGAHRRPSQVHRSDLCPGDGDLEGSDRRAEYFNSFDIDLFNDVPAMLPNGEIAMIPVGSWYQSNFLTGRHGPG